MQERWWWREETQDGGRVGGNRDGQGGREGLRANKGMVTRHSKQGFSYHAPVICIETSEQHPVASIETLLFPCSVALAHRYIGATEADFEWLTDQIVQVANK